MKEKMGRLYHFTDEADAILRDGFKGGDDGLVWFAVNPTQVLGERVRSNLLMAIFTVPLADLSVYGNPVKDDGPEEEKMYKGVSFYGIPANVINGIIRKVIKVPPRQRKKLTY